MQIRVYPVAAIRMGDTDPDLEPVCAAFIHRLPSKMSSIAWSPFDEVSAWWSDFACLHLVCWRSYCTAIKRGFSSKHAGRDTGTIFSCLQTSSSQCYFPRNLVGVSVLCKCVDVLMPGLWVAGRRNSGGL
jgi:hypothetical protein